jgi:hypothetical protein
VWAAELDPRYSPAAATLDPMVTEDELLEAVNAASEETGRAFTSWPDPHRDRSPFDEEYSRLTDPTKWRVIGARADAWGRALVDIADPSGWDEIAGCSWLRPP